VYTDVCVRVPDNTSNINGRNLVREKAHYHTVALSTHNKPVLYKQILKPVWTYGIQLWGCTKPSNAAIIQRFQNKLLRNIVDALFTFGTLTSIVISKWKWLRQKLNGSLGSMKRGFSITTRSKRFRCSTIVSYYEGLKEQNPLSWYHDHQTQNTGQCNTPTQTPIVFGKITRDASAVNTVNKGPMKRKHTNWTG
jgi:hypothetical protein